MGDAKRPLPGVSIGDYQIAISPALATSDEHDAEAQRERARRREEDARAAQRAPGDEGEAENTDVEEAVDASIAEARGDGDEPGVPILIRDPLTGIVVPGR